MHSLNSVHFCLDSGVHFNMVMIEGTIKGDLIAVGSKVVVSGSVGGNLIAFADSVTVSGQIDGFTLSAASSLELSEAVVKGDLWGAAGSVNIGRNTRIGRNATVATEKALILGDIKRDLFAFGESVELRGDVGEDFEVFAQQVSLLGDARVGGNLRYRTNDETNLQRSSTATVVGEVEFLPLSTDFQSSNEYLTGRFYLGQLVRLVGAFLVGIALLWLVPVLRKVTLRGGIAELKNAGIGLVAFISVPIILLLLAITLVGLPFALIGFFVWISAIYLAKIVLGSVIGRMLLSSSKKRDSLPLTLLAGLAAIFVAINLPAIGGIISFILTIVGIGMIVQIVLNYSSSLAVNPIA